MNGPKQIYIGKLQEFIIEHGNMGGTYLTKPLNNTNIKYHRNDILLSCQHDNNQLSAEVSKLNDVVEELKAQLLDAANKLEEWGPFINDNHKEEFGFNDEIKEIRDAAK